MSKYYVYRFKDKDSNIIYIGKSKSIKNRIDNHNHLPKECYDSIYKIEYAELNNHSEGNIYEIYLINKYSPKYNIIFNRNDEISFNLPDLKWLDIKNEINIEDKSDKFDFYYAIDDEYLLYFLKRINQEFMVNFINDIRYDDLGVSNISSKDFIFSQYENDITFNYLDLDNKEQFITLTKYFNKNTPIIYTYKNGQGFRFHINEFMVFDVCGDNIMEFIYNSKFINEFKININEYCPILENKPHIIWEDII